MSKKQPEGSVDPATKASGLDPSTGEIHEDFPGEFAPDAAMVITEDFDTEAEYKPVPLIPKGKYHANVTQVAFDPENQIIVWTVTFNENEGRVKLDGESPVDGSTMNFKNWLPLPGDEKAMTKTGSQTKRQAKINMLQDFAKDMKIDMRTPVAILTSLANQEWLGLSVIAEVGFSTWNNRTFNVVNKMSAS
jgi:hypothetical protein